MARIDVRCPDCNSLNIVRYGRQPNGEQRYRCLNGACERRIFLLNYRNRVQKDEDPRALQQKIISMALFGRGAMETTEALGADPRDVLQVYEQLAGFDWSPAAEPVAFRHLIATS
jgi:transposase-like protein